MALFPFRNVLHVIVRWLPLNLLVMTPVCLHSWQEKLDYRINRSGLISKLVLSCEGNRFFFCENTGINFSNLKKMCTVYSKNVRILCAFYVLLHHNDRFQCVLF